MPIDDQETVQKCMLMKCQEKADPTSITIIRLVKRPLLPVLTGFFQLSQIRTRHRESTRNLLLFLSLSLSLHFYFSITCSNPHSNASGATSLAFHLFTPMSVTSRSPFSPSSSFAFQHAKFKSECILFVQFLVFIIRFRLPFNSPKQKEFPSVRPLPDCFSDFEMASVCFVLQIPKYLVRLPQLVTLIFKCDHFASSSSVGHSIRLHLHWPAISVSRKKNIGTAVPCLSFPNFRIKRLFAVF